MKKLSFFLMAMLFSMMSFAQTVLFTQTYPGSPSAWTNAYTNSFNLTTDGYKLTYQNINNGKQADGWTAIRSGSKRAASVATILSEQIAKPIAKVAINFTQVKASSTNALYLEVSATADFASATKIEADIAKGTVEFAIATPAANQYYRVTIDQDQDSDNGFNRWDKVIFYEGEAASGDVEIVAAPEYSVANANFTTPFTLEITSAEGTTLKYTLDNTDPNTSATAVEVATNKTTVEIAKSTVVKAIAIKGELVSVTKTKTYSYVNTPETAYTVAEAIDVINAGLGLDNELYAKGEIYKIDSYNSTYKSITYWIKDEANNQLQVYSGRGLNNTDFASKDDLVVGSKVVICGILKKYNSTYEFDKTNYIVSLTLPSYTVTATAENGSVEGLAADGNYEHGAEATLTATAAEGYEFTCWTSGKDTVSTANPYKFTVTADVALVANFIKKTISYELNGGAFPEVKVPTNAELWEAFKPYYNEYYDLARADQSIDKVSTFANQYMQQIMTDEASEYKWLGDYVLSVATAAGVTLSTDMAAANEGGWRWAVHAFFNAAAGQHGAAGIDFTEAGKPEVWGAAYLAEYGVVLPTEPVDAPYTLPTPVKEGYKFVGWYDNAEGTGEPMTVIPAGWDGTLYAIWVEIYTITVEAENGTVEGAGNYEHGAEATLTATAAEGYEFTCWTSGEDTVSTANPYKFTVTADVALVANFKLIPPTKYTVTLSDNTGGFEPLTSGAGEYEEGDEVTVSAVDSEGWVFVGWMDENGDIVSNDYQYTFVIEGNVELVAIYAQLMELEVNDLEIITEPVVGLTGTAELMPGMTLSFELIVDDSEQGDDGEFYLTEDSKVYLNDETELEFQEGIALIDMMSNTAQAQVLAAMGEALYLFKLDMSAAAAEPTNVLVTNAVKSYDEESGALKLTGLWEGVEVFVEIAGYDGKESIEYSTLQGVLFETPDVAAFGNEASIIVAGEDITVVCNGLKPNMGNDVYNVTITTLSEVSTALDNLNTTVAPVKMIENGQLIIINNGVQFNAQGQVIK